MLFKNLLEGYQGAPIIYKPIHVGGYMWIKDDLYSPWGNLEDDQ